MREALLVLNDSRDAARGKDSWGVNVLLEREEGETPVAVKRPGLTDAFPGITPVIGQGLFNFAGQAYGVVGDSLLGPLSIVPPWNPLTYYTAGSTVSYGGLELDAVDNNQGQNPGSAGGSAHWQAHTGGAEWTLISSTSCARTAYSLSAASLNTTFTSFGSYVYAHVQGLGTFDLNMYRSSDMVNWTLVQNWPFYYVGREWVKYVFNGVLYLINGYAHVVLSSTDGTTWTSGASAPFAQYAIPWMGLLFCTAAGYAEIDSYDSTFTLQHVAALGGSINLLFLLGSYLYVVFYDRTMQRTSDGVNWTSFTPTVAPPAFYFQSYVPNLVFGGAAHIYLQVGNAVKEYTFDGTTWALAHIPSFSVYNGYVLAVLFAGLPYVGCITANTGIEAPEAIYEAIVAGGGSTPPPSRPL